MTTSSNSRILIIGDAVAPTGFARVIRSIFEPLHVPVSVVKFGFTQKIE